jgi:hypothetical protein
VFSRLPPCSTHLAKELLQTAHLIAHSLQWCSLASARCSFYDRVSRDMTPTSLVSGSHRLRRAGGEVLPELELLTVLRDCQTAERSKGTVVGTYP